MLDIIYIVIYIIIVIIIIINITIIIINILYHYIVTKYICYIHTYIYIYVWYDQIICAMVHGKYCHASPWDSLEHNSLLMLWPSRDTNVNIAGLGNVCSSPHLYHTHISRLWPITKVLVANRLWTMEPYLKDPIYCKWLLRWTNLHESGAHFRIGDLCSPKG